MTGPDSIRRRSRIAGFQELVRLVGREGEAGVEQLSRTAAACAGDLIGAYRRVFIGVLPLTPLRCRRP
jgi:hypothetical protein